MINVLLDIAFDSHFVELSRLARLLSGTGKYNPIFWFRSVYPTLARDLEICDQSTWEYIAPPAPPPSEPEKRDELKPRVTLIRWIKKLILWFIPGRIRRALFFNLEVKSQAVIINELASNISSILDQKQIGLIVLSEDNIGYFTNVIIESGKRVGIPSVILPYTICNASEAAECFYSVKALSAKSTLIHRYIAKKYPHWVYKHRNRSIFRLHPATIYAMEKSGFPCKQPWQLNSERSTTIAVENERMHTYYLNEGLDESRLVLTGAIYDDVLAAYSVNADQKKKRLIEELGLIENQPILLCALPPDQFPRDCEFSNYPDLIKFWMESLAAIQGWNVLIRPHPRQTASEIAALENFGLKVTTADTASLVPLCDLYLASVSATIRWAIACGKPVINYDVYRMNYKDYAGVGGVLTKDNRDSYLSALQKMTGDQDFFAEIQKLQIESSQSWGKLDGRSSERIIQLFDTMIANSSPKV